MLGEGRVPTKKTRLNTARLQGSNGLGTHGLGTAITETRTSRNQSERPRRMSSNTGTIRRTSTGWVRFIMLASLAAGLSACDKGSSGNAAADGKKGEPAAGSIVPKAYAGSQLPGPGCQRHVRQSPSGN